MPIGSITTQPATNSINAAYRPIVFQVTATRTDGNAVPPVVYCDIYFAGVFYKTISKTHYLTNNGSNTTWQFDIQDAVQEVLGKYIEDNGTTDVTEIEGMITTAYCKFRSSGFDVDGFLVQEGTPPIQGNDEDDPVSGTGTQSNTFYCINATLQHEDNQSLTDHLDSYKVRTWAANTFPLTHRPDRYKLCTNDSDSFPILSDKPPLKIVVHYIDENGTEQSSGSNAPCSAAAPTNSTNIPNASAGVAYNYTLNLSGTAPFNITNEIKPSWMAINVSGSSIIFSGTPDAGDVGTGIPVSFTINNCINSTYAFNEVIDVACVVATYDGDPALPDATENADYEYTLELNGTLPINLNNIVKPSWMAINITGNVITFSGTPPSPATNEAVTFDIDNCGGTLPYSQTIDTIACVAVSISNDQLPDAVVGVAYNELVPFDTGTQPIITNIGSTKPAWMSVAVESGGLRFTGTPQLSDIDTNVPISIVLTNCGGGDTYTDTINVASAQHRDINYYTGFENAIFDVCTVQVGISRSAQATTDAQTANERVEVEYRITADTGCIVDDTIIFEVSDSIKYEDVDVLCGTNYACTSATVTILTITVIP